MDIISYICKSKDTLATLPKNVKGYTIIEKYIAEHPEEVNKFNEYNSTDLSLAIKNIDTQNKIEFVKKYIKIGPNWEYDLRLINSDTFLLKLIRYKVPINVIKEYCKCYPEEINQRGIFSATPLHIAIRLLIRPERLESIRVNSELIHFLCQHGADVNQLNSNGSSPLDVTCDYNGYNGSDLSRKILLEYDASIHTRDKYGRFALYPGRRTGAFKKMVDDITLLNVLA